MRRGLAPALTALLLTPEPQAAGALSQEPLYAGVQLFYGPGEHLENIDARLVDGARQSIDMAAYVFTDRALVAALGRAAARGVRVRVYLDGGETAGRAAPLAEIAGTPNLDVRAKGARRDLMHLKAYQIDGRTLRTGSANFSLSGESYQDNDLLVIESPLAAARFREAFDRLWARPDNRRIGAK